MFIGGFFLPLILIALFYILIVILLRKNETYLTYQVRSEKNCRISNAYMNSLYLSSELSLGKKKKLSIVVGKSSETCSRKKSRNNSSIYFKREIKLVKMICLIILMFTISWTPYALVTFAAQFGSNIEAYINPYTTALPAFFAKTSSVYNPLVYTLSNKDFRRFFVKMIGFNKGLLIDHLQTR